MALSIRTVVEDVRAICGYLLKKPTGATLAEAKAVVNKKHLDRRKLTGLRAWGFIEDEGDKIKLTERGRRAADESALHGVLCEVVREIPAYTAVVEKVVHRGESSITATEVATHWYEHFRSEVSSSENILNEQALCFLQVVEGAQLGSLIVGRRGKPTRFDFDTEATSVFVNASSADNGVKLTHENDAVDDERTEWPQDDDDRVESTNLEQRNNRVFITHGKNRKISEQVKELVAYGKFVPVVAVEHETAATPVPKKVMADMRSCGAAVIHVSAEDLLYDSEQSPVPQINDNVLIEIGAAMALYEDKFVLLVEEGVDLPSNLQGLYKCRYRGDELNMDAIMKLLKAMNEF